jgi:hypothetical protein
MTIPSFEGNLSEDAKGTKLASLALNAKLPIASINFLLVIVVSSGIKSLM